MEGTATNIYFSPGGTTKEVAGQISAAICDTVETVDLLKAAPTAERVFSADEVVVVAMPVFSGRLPTICVDMLHKFKGTSTPAVAVVVYGNREYEDALLELSDILTANGFHVVGGCAAIGRHSIFPEVAKGRPDSQDIEKIRAFAKSMAEKIQQKNSAAPSLPGNNPYRQAGPVTLHPTGNSHCNQCGACVQICPVKAVPENAPQTTNTDLCINCTACIYICPQKARNYADPNFPAAAAGFAQKYTARREPEFFV